MTTQATALPQREPLIVQAAVKQFLLASRADGLKGKTLVWYRSLLKRYAARYGLKVIHKVTVTDNRTYLVDVMESGYSADSIYDHHRALRRFWHWCEDEYGVPTPMKNIRYPKQPRPKDPKAVMLDDVVKMLRACDGTPQGRRDKAIVAFLMDTGCRAAGLCGLRMSDLDIPTGRAYVTEKGDKHRAVMFTSFTGAILLNWMVIRDEKQEYFFYGRFGKLTPNGLYQVLKKLRSKSGIKGRANPHAFRHGFAREYLMSGGDLASLAQILGNDEGTAARIYSVFAIHELARLHEERSPMHKINSALKNGQKGRF